MLRELLVLVALVGAVDAAAVAIYYLAGIPRAGPGVQLLFAVVWTVATLGVVVVSLRKIRLLR